MPVSWACPTFPYRPLPNFDSRCHPPSPCLPNLQWDPEPSSGLPSALFPHLPLVPPRSSNIYQGRLPPINVHSSHLLFFVLHHSSNIFSTDLNLYQQPLLLLLLLSIYITTIYLLGNDSFHLLSAINAHTLRHILCRNNLVLARDGPLATISQTSDS